MDGPKLAEKADETAVESPSGSGSGSSASGGNAAENGSPDCDGPIEESNGLTLTETQVKRRKRSMPWNKWSRVDEEQQDWWFASTAVPLLAATIAPLANVFSIAALVSYWREDLIGPDGSTLLPSQGITIKDPAWVYGTNLASLICGYIGNLFLFLNFTNRIPYIVALPVTIVLWFASTIILTAIQASMANYAAPGPNEDYTEAFWYGVVASVLYFLCALMLMLNMVGFFLGHYPSHFNLTNAQRTLILQTFLFFIWLAGGAAVFSKIQAVYGQPENQWDFAQAIYFADITILTIGFGDYTPDNNVGRGLVLPFSVGGIIMLGLMISSISTFAKEITATNIVQKRIDKERSHIVERTKDRSMEQTSGEGKTRRPPRDIRKLSISAPIRAQTLAGEADASEEPAGNQFLRRAGTSGIEVVSALRRTTSNLLRAATPGRRPHYHNARRQSILVFREEKDRFDAMRKIQFHSERFKRWSSLIASFTMLLLLWLIGAVVFWQLEKALQGWSYFDALYFAYISLLTIGYGDFTPKSSAGRPFFVVWSLLAVPSITILISDLSNTVVSSFRDWTNALGDFTLLAKDGIWREFLQRHPWLMGKIESRSARKARERRIADGFELGPDPDVDDENWKPKTIEQLAMRDREVSEQQLAKKLANAIKEVSTHIKEETPRKYSYEEWVEFTELVRFTRGLAEEREEEEEEDEGLIEWDWIGQDGPIMSSSEPEWLLDRLCESMVRYVRRQTRGDGRRKDNAKRKKWRPEEPTHDEVHDEVHEHPERNAQGDNSTVTHGAVSYGTNRNNSGNSSREEEGPERILRNARDFSAEREQHLREEGLFG